MTPIGRFILSISIIFASLAFGYLCKKKAEQGKFFANLAALQKAGRYIQNFAIFVLMPFSAMLSLWGLPAPQPTMLALPLLGVIAYTGGGAMAVGVAKALKLSRRQTGSFYCCGAFSNIGAIGGLICLIFLGENSIAIVAMYRLLEEMYFFGLSFPVARWFSRDAGIEAKKRRFRFNPAILIIILALLTGLGLNYAGCPRPPVFGTVASGSMLAATTFFLFAIGLALRLSSIGEYIAQAGVMCAIKFLGLPLLITPIAVFLGYGQIDAGIPLKTAFILSAMPVAMTALVPVAVYQLDQDLANACWIVSTFALLFILPVIIWLLPVL